MSDCRAPMPTYEMAKVCMNGHGPVYLKRFIYQYRCYHEVAHIGDMEAWRCPMCGAVYAFPKDSDCHD